MSVGVDVDIRGVIVRERGGTPRGENLQPEDALPGEVLVRILASGVCHSGWGGGVNHADTYREHQHVVTMARMVSPR